jgi:hypothetical protein
MKKFLLSLTAFVAVMAASAQDANFREWNRVFEPVSDAAELAGVRSAVSAEGDVYVSSTYNKAFAFAGKEVADPEGLTSATIVKYNVQGTEQWTVTFFGNAVIFDLDVDADGTLYAAGHYMDGLDCIGTDGQNIVLEGAGFAYSAFVAKISKDGKVEQVKSFSPVVDEEIASKMGDPWGEGVESPLYSSWDPIYVTPNKIQVCGDQVIVSAKYIGDVPELGWDGSYLDVFGMMYSDNYSYGVMALNKSDLYSAKSIAVVQNTELVSYDQFYPEALNFVAENGTVYVGFIGFGNLTLKTAAATPANFTFENDYNGTLEHAFVLATIKGEEVTTNVYNTTSHDKSAKPYSVFMDICNDDLFIGGTFFGTCHFDSTLTSGELANDTYLASVKKADGSVNWAKVGGKEATATCMSVNGMGVIFSTSASENSVSDVATGEVIATGAQTLADADAVSSAFMTYVYATDTKVNVCGRMDNAVSIENIEVSDSENAGVSYNLAGQPVNETYKGIVIKNGKKYLVK